ncbi:MAG: alcohol dehydrogenase catalytic domain-containing protein [Chloroherpetonaceae bacterium]|nr:alcohol dehydrogenase catalytic domain-containing protein [Chloroherpetonaceae bacterium]MCS7210915.1 alcohol dehydrogenase catalytic domain-containing protein [Chloroherpetonaceae bacterium]MDW8019741.1 alcohol dehydrogenase catalytic domain-containing protein [Chloroherpetonaceae bacterium]
MPKRPKAIIYPKPNRINLVELDMRPLGENDVRVRTIATSITPGVERFLLTGKSITRRELRFPVVSGSELLGEVVEVGANVADVEVGDYVFVSRADGWLEAMPLFGCQAEEVIASESCVIPIRRTLEEKDILIGLVGYAISAVKKINLEEIERILILGLGSVGLMIAEYLTYKGFTAIDACEKYQSRGMLAAAKDIAFDIEDFTSDYFDRYDVIVETTGRLLMLEQATKLLKPHGKFLLVGNYEVMKLDYRLIQDKEPILISSIQTTDDDLFEAKYLLSEDALDVEKFLTHRFPVADYERAFDVALNRADAIKTILTW